MHSWQSRRNQRFYVNSRFLRFGVNKLFTATMCGPTGSKIARICALVCFSDVLNTKKRTTNHFYPIHIRDYSSLHILVIGFESGMESGECT